MGRDTFSREIRIETWTKAMTKISHLNKSSVPCFLKATPDARLHIDSTKSRNLAQHSRYLIKEVRYMSQEELWRQDACLDAVPQQQPQFSLIGPPLLVCYQPEHVAILLFQRSLAHDSDGHLEEKVTQDWIQESCAAPSGRALGFDPFVDCNIEILLARSESCHMSLALVIDTCHLHL